MDNETRTILASLHEEYKATLPERIRTIESEWPTVSQLAIDDPMWERYYREVHDLSSSTGTHGYKPLSKSLRAFDKLLSAALKTGLSTLDNEAVFSLLLEIEKYSSLAPETPELFQSL